MSATGYSMAQELELLRDELRAAPTRAELTALKLQYERELGAARMDLGRAQRELKRYREFADDVDELRRFRDVCIDFVAPPARQRFLRKEANQWDVRWRERRGLP